MLYRVMHIPNSIYRRPGRFGEKVSITVHNTGCPNVPAINFQKNLCRPDNKTYASFHLVCDEKEVIECIPLNEEAFHCAKKQGNVHSIGIEVCERPGAELVAAEWIAKYLFEKGWGVDRVTTHKAWNGKNCPRLLLPKWSWFIGIIQNNLNKLKGLPQTIRKGRLINTTTLDCKASPSNNALKNGQLKSWVHKEFNIYGEVMAEGIKWYQINGGTVKQWVAAHYVQII